MSATAVLSDEEVERVEAARAEGGPVAEAAALAEIEADHVSPSRADIDAAHADAGEPVDVPGVPSMDPEIDEDPFTGQLSFTVGGKEPTSATVRLVGGKIEDGGEYEKGDVLVLRVEARVTEVAFVDERDPKTGQIVGCQRRHKLTPIATQVERG